MTIGNNKQRLKTLGISEAEEYLYRWLLARPNAKVSEIAKALMLSPARTQRLLDSLEDKGLATHTPERPRRFIPAMPDIALEALALQRENELHRLRTVIKDLTEQAMSARIHEENRQIVELISSRASERLIVDQMHRTAKREFVSLIRPPVLISRLDTPHEQDQRQQRASQARGVRYRSIVDSDLLNLPGAIARVRSDIQSGEEYRVLSHLPVKMIIADNSRAIIPLNVSHANGPSLVVRSSALLDALYALFETLWQRATPVSFFDNERLETVDRDNSASVPEGTQELISLMTAGLNDKKIAAELDISSSTLKRRVAKIMRVYGVRTRFQLGRLSHNFFPE